MKEVLIPSAFILTFLLFSTIGLGAVFSEAHLDIGSNDTNYNYRTNYTFNVTVVGGSPDYNVTFYLDGHTVWRGTITSSDGYYTFWKVGFPEGYHTVRADVIDENGICCTLDGLFCDNLLSTELKAFYVNAMGTVAPFTLVYNSSSGITNGGYRSDNFPISTSKIYNGTAPYNVTIRAYDYQGFINLVNCPNVAENSNCAGTFYGTSFANVSENKQYSIVATAVDSLGNSQISGNYYYYGATYPLTIYSDWSGLTTVSSPFMRGAFSGYFSAPYGTFGDPYRLNYTIVSGTPPFNVTLGYYNTTSSKSIGLCTFYNSYDFFYSVEFLPAINDGYYWTAYTFDSEGCNIVPESCGSVTGTVADSSTEIWGSSDVDYLLDPTTFWVKDCVEQGGVIGYPNGVNGGINSSSFQTFEPTENPIVEYTGTDYNPDNYYDQYGNEVTPEWTESAQDTTTFLGFTNDVMDIFATPIFLWTVLLMGAGIIAEIKVNRGGKLFGIILLVGATVLSIFNIYPTWIIIVEIVIVAVVGGLFIKKRVTGG